MLDNFCGGLVALLVAVLNLNRGVPNLEMLVQLVTDFVQELSVRGRLWHDEMNGQRRVCRQAIDHLSDDEAKIERDANAPSVARRPARKAVPLPAP